jgi:hypothetical protein
MLGKRDRHARGLRVIAKRASQVLHRRDIILTCPSCLPGRLHRSGLSGRISGCLRDLGAPLERRPRLSTLPAGLAFASGTGSAVAAASNRANAARNGSSLGARGNRSPSMSRRMAVLSAASSSSGRVTVGMIRYICPTKSRNSPAGTAFRISLSGVPARETANPSCWRWLCHQRKPGELAGAPCPPASSGHFSSRPAKWSIVGTLVNSYRSSHGPQPIAPVI